MQLYFLPGASGSTEFWQPAIVRLKSHWHKQVIAYPEFGGYPSHPNVKCFQDLQQFVIDKIQQDSVIIAQSMGGIFALQAALQQPEKVKALVLVATSGGIDLSSFDIADWRQDYQLNYSVPDWFVNDTSALDHELNKIQCPVLLIWGDQDLISPVSVGRYLEKQFKQAHLEIIEGGQHDLAHAYASKVSMLIAEFINKNQ